MADFSPSSGAKWMLLSARYDLAKGSSGVNDNASYAVMLFDRTTNTYRMVRNDNGDNYRMALDPSEAHGNAVKAAQITYLNAQQDQLDARLNATFQEESHAITTGADTTEILAEREHVVTMLEANGQAREESNLEKQDREFEETATMMAQRFSLGELQALVDQAVWQSEYMDPQLARAIELAEAQAQAQETQ